MGEFSFKTVTDVELSVLDGIVAGTVATGLAVVLDGSRDINYLRFATGGTLALATGAVFTLGTGNVSGTFDDFNKIAGITNGVVASGKAIVVADSKNIDYLVIASAVISDAGTFKLGASASITMGTASLTTIPTGTLNYAGGVVSATYTEINVLHTVVAGTVASGKAIVTNDAKSVDYLRLATGGTLALATGITFTLGTGGITALVDEINVLAGVTQGVAAGTGKAVVLSTGNTIDNLVITSAVIGTGNLTLGTGKITASYEDINKIAGITNGVGATGKAVILATGNTLDYLSIASAIISTGGSLAINASGALSMATGSILTIANLILVTGTPVNATAATATFQFVAGGEAVEAQSLKVDTEIYEFDFVGDGLTSGTIAVGTSGTGTATTAVVTYLVSAITNSSTLITAWTGATGRELAIAWKVSGATGNTKIVTATTTGAWVASALAGGVDGTVVAGRGFWYIDSSYVYYSVAANTIIDKNWRRIALGSSY